MKFEEALQEMRKGKKVKLSTDNCSNYSLYMISKIYYDGNPDRNVDVLSSEHILREDWEIVE